MFESILNSRKKIIFIGGILLAIFLLAIFIFVFFKGSSKLSKKAGQDIKKLNVGMKKAGYGTSTLDSTDKPDDLTQEFSNVVLPISDYTNDASRQATSNDENFLLTLRSANQDNVLSKMSSEEILDFAINKSGDGIIYVTKSDGSLVETGFTRDKKTRLTKKFIPKLKQVLLPERFDYNGILIKEDNSIYYYNFKLETEKKLSDKIRQDIKWSPSGDEIIYFYDDILRNGANVAKARPDNSQWEVLFYTQNSYIDFFWPHQDIVVLLDPPYNYFNGKFYIADLTRFDGTKNNLKLLFYYKDIRFQWSSQKDIFLYSFSSDLLRSRLIYKDLSKNADVPLNFYTLPENCRFSKQITTIYCFTTNETLINNGLLKASRDILPQNISFWKLDLEQGKVIEVAIPSEVYEPEKILLSPNEDYLIFKNKLDNFLYSVRLR